MDAKIITDQTTIKNQTVRFDIILKRLGKVRDLLLTESDLNGHRKTIKEAIHTAFMLTSFAKIDLKELLKQSEEK